MQHLGINVLFQGSNFARLLEGLWIMGLTHYPQLGEFYDNYSESYEEAARRETLEETGVDVDGLELTHIEGLTLASKAAAEYGDFYLCEITDQTKSHKRELDAEEDIDEIEWFDLYDVDLEKMRIPLGTKYIIEKARLYYAEQRELDKRKKISNEEPER